MALSDGEEEVEMVDVDEDDEEAVLRSLSRRYEDREESANSDEVDEDDEEEEYLGYLGKKLGREEAEEGEGEGDGDGDKVGDEDECAAAPDVQDGASEDDESARVSKERKGGRKRKSKEDMEGLYAESQRLLRESRGAAFAVQPAVPKPISSVLEKIRARKLQLKMGPGGDSCWRQEVRMPVDRTETDLAVVSGDGELRVEADGAPSGMAVVAMEDSEGGECAAMAGLEADGGGGSVGQGGDGRGEEGQGSELPGPAVDGRAVADSPDLFSYSQLSSGSDGEASPGEPSEGDPDSQGQCEVMAGPTEDSSHLSPARAERENDTPCEVKTPSELRKKTPSGLRKSEVMAGPREDALQLSPARVERQKDKVKIPSEFITARAMIDDEAEDEDDDGNVNGDSDEDVDENEGDLQDLVASTVEERPSDRRRREKLHQEWLEERDNAATDDILHKLKHGWKRNETRERAAGFLDEDFGLDSLGGSKDAERLSRRARAVLDQNTIAADGVVEPAETTEHEEAVICEEEEEDDENAEQEALMRQLLESEEQEDFLIGAMDGTSRDVMGMINRVRVPQPQARTSSSTVAKKPSPLKPSFLNRRKPSFLNRLPSGHSGGKKGSCGVPSFIFGPRSGNLDKKVDKGDEVEIQDKENHAPAHEAEENAPRREQLRFPSIANRTFDVRSTSAKPTGSSLHDLLKAQAAKLDKSLQANSPPSVNRSRAGLTRMFGRVKSFKAGRGSRNML